MSVATAAAALADQLQTALEDAGYPSAVATTDPDDAYTAANSGSGVILIGPPVIEYGATLALARDAVWPVTVAYRGAGAWDAWQHIDALLDVAAGVLELDTARPGQILPTGANNDPIPAYIATTHPTAL